MLQGIIAQSLVPHSDRKGLVAAVEVMLGTDAVKNHIRSNKIPQMETVMHGSTQLGMQTLTESLAKLYHTIFVRCCHSKKHTEKEIFP